MSLGLAGKGGCADEEGGGSYKALGLAARREPEGGGLLLGLPWGEHQAPPLRGTPSGPSEGAALPRGHAGSKGTAPRPGGPQKTLRAG